ncbi:hypothetical protein LB518_23025 [Mesorhizobium sp. BR1-1-16]|uniref:hypothetical protein n=1 Tax=Mesorhizobium sp. BR1-1-16 TaxID=2876653 RepID=UPI001CD04061|nr:hypothetical protein [Mesorhizobium sp. BR1-1-16]MBZ9939189.1 hypothetical protein [Mesorhizobium sp. BR1-1-16]
MSELLSDEDFAELLDRLNDGLKSDGEQETDNGVIELFDLDGAREVVAETADAIRDERTRRQEAEAKLAAAEALNAEMLAALKSLGPILDEVHDRWDKDMKAGKLLIALIDPTLRYRSDITAIHDVIAKADAALNPSEKASS